jgi:putative chitobiose transport system substrate-binding protein
MKSMHEKNAAARNRLGRRCRADVAGIALIIVLSLLLFSCDGSSESGGSKEQGEANREITFLTMQLRPTFDDYFETLIADFEASHPGVKVHWLDYPYQNYETKLMTAFLGGDPPDVINLSSETIPTWKGAGHIRPLDDLLDPSVAQSFVPSIIRDGCTLDEKLYALPWYLSAAIVVCNQQIFEEAGIPIDKPPAQYEEIPEICRVIQEKTGKFGYFPLYTEAGSMRGWLMDAAIPLVTADGKQAAFNTPRAVQVVKFWTDLYKERLVPSEALTAMHRRPIEFYKGGRLAVMHSGTEFLRQIKADAPEVYASSIIGPQLQWEGNDVHNISFHVVSVAKEADHPELAAEFAAYVTNAQNQLAFCKLTTIIPSVTKALQDPYFTDPEDTLEGKARQFAADHALKATVVRLPDNTKKLFKTMDDIIENICLGKMTAEEGVAKAAEDWNRILNE